MGERKNAGIGPGRVVLYVLAVTGLAVLLTTLVLVPRFLADEAVACDDPEEHFKYGSTGGERDPDCNCVFPYRCTA